MILAPCFRIDAGLDLPTNQMRQAPGRNFDLLEPTAEGGCPHA